MGGWCHVMCSSAPLPAAPGEHHHPTGSVQKLPALGRCLSYLWALQITFDTSEYATDSSLKIHSSSLSDKKGNSNTDVLWNAKLRICIIANNSGKMPFDYIYCDVPKWSHHIIINNWRKTPVVQKLRAITDAKKANKKFHQEEENQMKATVNFIKKPGSNLADDMKHINYACDGGRLNWLFEKTDWQLPGWVSEFFSFGFNRLPNFY